MDLAAQRILLVTRILIALIFLNGLSYCFTTYAVAPDKYENKQYTLEEVNRIAYLERVQGVEFAYRANKIQLYYVYLPMGCLLIINFGLSTLIARRKK
jgi:hypothetical protein